VGLHTFYGSTPLSAYSPDVSGAAITVTGGFYVLGGTDGYQLFKVRIYLAGGADYTGAYAYVWQTPPKTLISQQPAPGLVAGWNDITLATPYPIAEYPGGKYFNVAVYLPHGGYVVDLAHYPSNAPTPCPNDANINVASPGDYRFDPSLGFGLGNNAYAPGTLTTPSDPSGLVFADPNGGVGGGAHYGLDIQVGDPAEPPVGGGAAPANTIAPAVTPATSVHTGDTIASSTGTWSNVPTGYAYQWQRAGTNIGGATTNTRVCAVADEGQALRCVVTASNATGSTSATSNVVTPTAPVAGAPSNTIAPVITTDGTPQTGETVSCSTGTWTNTPTGYTYQWQRAGGTLPGATANAYTLQPADEGQSIRCVVTATNASGSASAPSNAILAAAISTGGGGTGATGTDEMAVLTAGAWRTLSLTAAAAGNSGGMRITHEAGVRPEDYGVIGGADDAATLELTIFTAVKAAMNNGSFITEVFLDPTRTYNLTRNPTVGGTIAGLAKLGNSQVGFPAVIPEANQHAVIRLTGLGEASCNHWAQPVRQRSGATLKSTVRTAATDGTYKAPSVLGSPTVQVGSNGLAPNFSNILVAFDGVTITMPKNPGMIGVDMRGAAQFAARRCLFNVDATSGELSATPPTDQNGIGVYYPSPGNNAVADAQELTIQGYWYGAGIAEHFVCDRALILHCNRALFFNGLQDNSTSHTSVITYGCFEAVQTVVEMNGNAASPVGLTITELDLELIGSSQAHVIDPSNLLRGEIGWNDYTAAVPRLTNGGRNLRIIDRKTARGASSLTVPASAAAGPVVWRDRRIHIGGGTISAVNVDGLVLPDVPRAFDVPSGRPWSVTYTGSPTAVQVAV
jgi:hypothetical protein